MKTSELSKKEFYDNKRTNNQRFCLTRYQRLVSNIINPLSPYESLLVYASVGIGKTLLSISVAENFKNAGYKILVVLKNETLINSYKKELTDNKCKPGNIKDYIFMTYHSFNKTQVSLDNTVTVVDEAHNITDVETYTTLKDSFGKSVNSRMILMSATPVYDNILEIFQLNNILNAKEPDSQLPIKISVLLENGYINKKSSSILDSAIFLTDTCKQVLKKTMNNKVSYFHSEESDMYAKKIYIGDDFYNKKLKLYISKMSSFQKKVYRESFASTSNTLFKKSIDASTIIYPNGMYGTEGFKTNIKKDSDLSFLKMENLNKYSCKLYSIVKCVKEHKTGSIFIFSNYTNNAGSDLIDKILKINNIRSFVVINGNTTQKRVTNILKKFNSTENKDGGLLRIIIGSPFISEGVTLKNVRYIHILEPSWNMSSIDQIIGRGLRYLSHSDLQLKERKVEIYLHAALDKKDDSIDILKYKLSHEKDMAIKDLEYLLREISIDCTLNKYTTKSKDYSRECLYKKCNYICSHLIQTPIDNTTYNVVLHDSELHSFIQNKLQDLYNKGFIYDVDYIIKYIQEDKKETLNVIYDLIKKETVFYNKNNVECKLVNLDNYILAQPIDLDVDLSYYYKVNNVIYKNRGFDIVRISGLTKNKVLPSKVSYKTLEEKVYGTIIKSIFRIVIKDNNCITNDNRCLTNGKACLSFDKTELQKIALLFGIKLIGSKVDMCNTLQNIFTSKNLIAV